MEVNAVCNVSECYVMALRNKSVLEEDMDFVTNLGNDIFFESYNDVINDVIILGLLYIFSHKLLNFLLVYESN